MPSLTRVLFASLLAAAAGAAACKKPTAKAKNDPPAAAGSTTDLGSDRSMQVMNAYVEYFNDVIDVVPRMSRGYWDKAGEAGLTVDVMTRSGNLVCAGAGWMKLQRDKAGDRVAALERQSSGEFARMPALARAMLDASLAYATVRDAMCGYVKGGGYKADAGARAKELHAEMTKAAASWDGAVDALASELERIEDTQSQAELARHEADKGYGYWFRLATIRSNEALRLLRRDAVRGEAGLAALTEALAGFTSFVGSKGDKLPGSFAGFATQVERLQKALGKLGPALAAARTPVAKRGVVEDASKDLMSIYNTMVGLHNTLVSQEGNGQLR